MNTIRNTCLALLASSIIVMTVGGATAQTRQLSCAGMLIAPTSSQSTLALRLNIDSDKKVAVDTGSGAVKAPVVSNNKVQLKFRTKQFVGEFFHYTNDLFLIYPSGHLARLTCSPG